MAWCTLCGTADQSGRFCANCGASMDGPTVQVDPGAPTPTVLESALTDTVLRGSPTVSLSKGPPPVVEPSWGPPVGQVSATTSTFVLPPAPGFANAPAGGTYVPSGPPPTGKQGGSGRRRGWLIAGAAFVVVAALAATALLVLRPSGSSADGITVTSAAPVATAVPPETAPPETAPPTTAAESKANPTGAGRSVAATATATTPAAGTTVAGGAPAPSTAPAVADPLGGPLVNITCGSGYIVQVASEEDEATFARKVAELRKTNTLPPGAKRTDINSSCQIFTAQKNYLVLYAGPFASPFDACPARLASPPDAFIKGTTPETAKDYISCLCPAVPAQLPVIGAVGQQDVWVGELQRVLGTGLDYNVGSVNADPAIGDPGRWGTYTAETAAAVGRFQGDSGLPVTEQVDDATWSALQAQSC